MQTSVPETSISILLYIIGVICISDGSKKECPRPITSL
jgi:hypothetical protein